MRLRALVRLSYSGGRADPGDVFDEQPLPAIGLVRNRLAVPADGDTLAATRRRLARDGVLVGAPMGRGAPLDQAAAEQRILADSDEAKAERDRLAWLRGDAAKGPAESA